MKFDWFTWRRIETNKCKSASNRECNYFDVSSRSMTLFPAFTSLTSSLAALYLAGMGSLYVWPGGMGASVGVATVTLWLPMMAPFSPLL